MSTEPVLPAELEREVFETAALIYPQTIPPLLRVARRVHIWIEPLLYQVVRVVSTNRDMVLTLLNSKPPEFWHAVRHLGLEDGCSLEEGRQLLSLCKNVINFSSDYFFTYPSLLPILAQMHIEKLSLTLHELFGAKPIDLTHTLFQSLTHIDMFGLQGVAEALVDLPTLRALTHLCLHCEIPRDTVTAVLADCPRLQLLLVQWAAGDDLYEAECVPHVYDIRFVIGMYDDYWTDWEAGARGGIDMWAVGDDFVRSKRRGEIEATCYWLM
ncbi:hypothetical protein B0H13DRAFT_1978971 [Mycena leptocephala]|nr:hypothetical protein B0H13DRAFT_1978971 [Mycena leptocephala]